MRLVDLSQRKVTSQCLCCYQEISGESIFDLFKPQEKEKDHVLFSV